MTASVLYYACDGHPPGIDEACRVQLRRATTLPIICVSLNQALDFGDVRIVMQGRRGAEMMHRQILAGLDACETDAVCFCESDVLYHPSHFAFRPPREDQFFYNVHTYKVDATTGRAVFYYCNQVSGLCASRDLVRGHYQRRLDRIMQDGRVTMRLGFEPGNHPPPRGVDHYTSARWMSESPNVDIRHRKNVTKTRWRVEDFRDPRTCEGWREVSQVPGWAIPLDQFAGYLHGLALQGAG